MSIPLRFLAALAGASPLLAQSATAVRPPGTRGVGTALNRVSASAVGLGGALTIKSIASAEVAGKAVVLVVDFRKSTSAINQLLGALFQKGPASIVMLSNRDSASFAQRVVQQFV